MKMQECSYCWMKFESYLYKCPHCGKLVEEKKEKESFISKFKKKWSNK